MMRQASTSSWNRCILKRLFRQKGSAETGTDLYDAESSKEGAGAGQTINGTEEGRKTLEPDYWESALESAASEIDKELLAWRDFAGKMKRDLSAK